jgi:hypothetical protein
MRASREIGSFRPRIFNAPLARAETSHRSGRRPGLAFDE